MLFLERFFSSDCYITEHVKSILLKTRQKNFLFDSSSCVKLNDISTMQAGFTYFDKNVPAIAIRSLFDKYDMNRNGKLEQRETQTLLEGDLGLNREQSWLYFLLVDKNGDHDISFEEFSDWLRSEEQFEVLNNKVKFDSLCKAFNYFKTFDTDDSDTLDRAQFERMMKFFGHETINMDKAFAKMDKDENGKVSFWEFMLWLKWIPLFNN